MKKYYFLVPLGLIVLCVISLMIYRAIQTPSTDRDRIERDAVAATVTIQGDDYTISNMRDFVRRSDDDYDIQYYDKTFDINDVVGVDYYLSTFALEEKLGHTFLSFILRDGTTIPVSIEARKEQGEDYHPLPGILNQYELMYVLADEEDLVSLRTQVRGDPVYRYQLTISDQQAQNLLASLLHTTQELSEHARFYNTITDNCTSALRKHANHLAPGKLPLHRSLLVTGLSDYYLFDRGYIQTQSTREKLRSDHRINEKVHTIVGKEKFSILLRE